MYAALNQENELIYATQFNNKRCKKGNYVCPRCYQVVFLKESKKGKLYFAHQVACGTQVRQNLPGGESNQHLLAKSLLSRASNQARVEVRVEERGQEIDVLVPPNLILEYQKSKVSALDLGKRHEAYLQAGYDVYWITSQEELMNPRLTKWKKTMIQYQSEYGYHWWGLDLERENLSLVYRLPLLFRREAWSAYVANWVLKKDWIQSFSLSQGNPKRREWKGGGRRQADRYQMAVRQGEIYRPFFFYLAQEGVSLTACPRWIFSWTWETPCLIGPAWVALVLIWTYIKKKQGQLVGKQDLLEVVRYFKKLGLIQVFQPPLVDKEIERDWIEAIGHCFAYWGHLKRIDRDKWLVV